jgi:hypothetical protein
MRRPLLVADALVNLLLGVLLISFPRGLVRALGIPDATPAFYAGILGAVLFGIGLALLLEAYGRARGLGLGLGGAILINSCGAIVLAGWLLVGGLAMPFRGVVFLWSLVVVLAAISALEAWDTWARHRGADEAA